MKIYDVTGYLIVVLYGAACVYSSPTHLGPWKGLLIGESYFVCAWFLCGLYLADILHMGVAHRALDYKTWFIKVVAVLNNTLGLYVNPITWVNRHRLHHKNSDHEGDPNKLDGDGFWRTMYLCMKPYRCMENLAADAQILETPVMRFVSRPIFALVAQCLNLYLMWRLVGSLKFALVMWVGTRIFALWVNLIQNYWTHTRKFGYRRYDYEHDNAMNIGEWLPVTATFSACLQNNHHHYPTLLRLSHHESEYDFGFMTVRVMKALGLVKATQRGAILPNDVPLGALDF